MTLPTLVAEGQVVARVQGGLGVITLNRAAALNALSLPMIRDVTSLLLHWLHDDAVNAVWIEGAGREGRPPAFCAGGDIRFFHQAALAGDPRLEDFFTEEYALNHLIHLYPKPYVAAMDGVTMGGGMGISQGAALRVVSEHSKLAMPETRIGLFPDVGGGWFLSRCPGRLGEYLALTGQAMGAADAIDAGLADVMVPSAKLGELRAALADAAAHPDVAVREVAERFRVDPAPGLLPAAREDVDRHFGAADLSGICTSLAQASSPWARATLDQLNKCSPLMMAVTLELLRRARSLDLAQDLRVERNLVRNCFHLRPGVASETVEGIRALAVDKDHAPRWHPASVADVRRDQVDAFFSSPWPAHAHPLRDLCG